MAGTRFAYVRNFELPDSVIPETYLVVRIDGKGFHTFSKAHNFSKPNDAAALELMNEAARHVMSSLKGQIALAFGESDEYSFLLRKSTTLYSRRNSKITTHIVSLFTSAYVLNWTRYFPNQPLTCPPSFDGRMVVYPNDKVVRDYFSWRQADTHINNLYNTTFWALVLHGGRSEQEATKELEGTVSSDKHEILHSKFGINYDQLEPIFRKGSTLVWATELSKRASTSMQGDAVPSISQNSPVQAEESNSDVEQAPMLNNPKDEKLRLKIERKRAAKEAKHQEKRNKKAQLSALCTLHCDIIGDDFWQPLPLSAQPPTVSEEVEQGGSTDISTLQPWNHPSRLQGAGLGTSIFLD
ncbi:related to THG1 - protein required for tRNA-His guanylylation at 5` end [Melanopsichium pennsylvanicum]|uniref:tRNA(His) guanylyltransferase n=2 Tax=Melanopsichium pennsylvanicum TaxID=63383 RepID=A0AAJ4XH95_9BASI|nr:related to THG1-protein required for tRNA-His guanylylation at 5 prime end [Melanopsichium pennsylvanicum 4]SNX81701.1 related to THG1 - protein required for tRNA-His guanylylation at 5` end [Melanopsichium pennsylvanicum]